MGDYDYGDNDRFEIWAKDDAARSWRKRVTHDAKLDGFMDAGIWVTDTRSGYGFGEKKLAVQEVLTCGKCYSLVPLSYIQEHVETHKEKK